MVGDAPGDGGQGKQARGQAFGGALAVGVGDDVVLAEAKVGAVLLGGADGDEHEFDRLGGLGHFRPGHLVQGEADRFAHRGVQGVAPAGDAAAGEQVVGRVEEGGDELVGAFLNDADHAPAVLGGGQGGVADGAVGGEVGEVVVAADRASPEALAQDGCRAG